MGNCKMCGGTCKEVVQNGRTVYRCSCCGSISESLAQTDSNALFRAMWGDVGTNDDGYKTTQTTATRACALSGEDIYDKVIDATVEIYVEGKNSAARASGFIIASQGLVVTNAHAVLDSRNEIFDKIYVKIKGEYHVAYVVAIGRPYRPSEGKNTVDLCLLFVEDMARNSATVELGDIQTIKNGQKVYLIGNSLGEGTCITSGIISDKSRAVKGLSYPYIMTDAAANSGNSGGPLLDTQGKVIGVLVAGIDAAEGMNFAIPVDVLKQFLITVFKEAGVNPREVGEVGQFLEEGNMSNKSIAFMTALDGIKLAVDVIAYIVNVIKGLRRK